MRLRILGSVKWKNGSGYIRQVHILFLFSLRSSTAANYLFIYALIMVFPGELGEIEIGKIIVIGPAGIVLTIDECFLQI